VGAAAAGAVVGAGVGWGTAHAAKMMISAARAVTVLKAYDFILFLLTPCGLVIGIP